MLLGILLTLSAAAALVICYGTGALESLSWLWMLPVGFLGSFLGLVVLAFLLLCMMAACVKMDKPQEKDSPLYRRTVDLLIPFAITMLQVRLHTQGLEKTPKEGRFVVVCNHLDNVDPAILLRAFRKNQLAFVSKRENDKKFLIGPFLHKMACQPINRENDREALKTILKCVELLKADEVSIGVFPEGYVSKDKKLHPFRSGVFKIAQRAQVPIVVCTLRNTHHVLHNGFRLKPTDVHLHLVGVIPAEELKGVTAVQIGDRVHAMMAEDLGPDLVLQADLPQK